MGNHNGGGFKKKIKNHNKTGGGKLYNLPIIHQHSYIRGNTLQSPWVESESPINTNTIGYFQPKTIPKEDGKSSESFFILEKLLPTNIDFWTSHAKFNKKNIPINDRVSDQITNNPELTNGVLSEYISSFQESLLLFEKMNSTIVTYPKEDKYDIFIAYVTNKNPTKEIIDSESIEMCVSMMAKDTIPIISIVGYFQSNSYYNGSYISYKHKNIYFQLTMFCSSIAKVLYPSILYLVTKLPQYVISNLFSTINRTLHIENMGFNTNISVGSLYDRQLVSKYKSDMIQGAKSQSQLQSIEIEIQQQTMQFYPPYQLGDITQMAINDLSPSWELNIINPDQLFNVSQYSDYSDIETFFIPYDNIECPPWILSKKPMNLAHKHLLNYYDDPTHYMLYPTVTINIEFFKKIWDKILSPIEPFTAENRRGYIQTQIVEKDGNLRKLRHLKNGGSYSIVQFVFEKLSPHNVRFWKEYGQINKTDDSKSIIDVNNNSINLADAVNPFNAFFKLYDSMANHVSEENTYDLWIAYIYHGNCLSPLRTDNIEMSFIIMAKEGIPVTSHMGIFKNLKCFKYGLNPATVKSHKGISIPLHIFAMAASRLIYPDIQYMLTRPVSIMTSILLSKIPKGHIWVGTNRDRFFTLYNMKESLINIKQKDNTALREKMDKLKNKISDNNTIEIINRELELLYEDKNQLMSDIFAQYNENSYDIMPNEFLFEPPIDNKNKNLNLNLVPIDDTDLIWKLTKKDGTILEFKCPGWYLANSSTRETYFNHPNLKTNYVNIFEGDHLLNAIVDIDLAIEESLIPLLDYTD